MILPVLTIFLIGSNLAPQAVFFAIIITEICAVAIFLIIGDIVHEEPKRRKS